MKLIHKLLNKATENQKYEFADEIIPRDSYYLMFYDLPLVDFKFSWEAISDPLYIPIEEVSYKPRTDYHKLFPIRLGYDYSREIFADWMNRRALPVMRSSYKRILKELRLSGRASMLSHGFALSLNDVYWIKPINNPVSWRDINLYKHEFSRRIANIAAGRLEYIKESTDTTSSPEYTTDGILPKFWKREEGTIYLYKEGERESAREVVASAVLRILGIEHVSYTCKLLGGQKYSKCEIFTNERVGHVPFFDVYAGRGKDLTVIRDYEELFYDLSVDFGYFRRMILSDYILQNVDRHFNNFGFSVDNQSNKIVGFSPLFDHGLCLFGKVEFAEERELKLKSLPPDMDHFEFIKNSLTGDLKYRMEELINSCRPGGAIQELCLDLLENQYWNRWSCDNSMKWMIKSCEALLHNKGVSTWNRYKDPSYLELF